MEADRPTPALERTLAIQEQAALERRHWVRVSFGCNNRCGFCLDQHLHRPSGFLDDETIRAEIAAGRAVGAERLILSGGEASIHPRFLDLVRWGREAGYARVQTITNGRMFAYRRFTRDAVAAGLGEVTFSLHSHEEGVFEQLTGVPGSFQQALAGLQAALAEPALIVSVDIVINRLNADTLDETVAFYAELGVTEFDLLHLVPFGRAYDEALREVPLAVDPVRLRGPLDRTIALGAARGLVLWTNRLPAPLLEGHEHLIQDPHKLVDEVRGRNEHVRELVERGQPLPCRDERCAVCYLTHYCDVLHPLQGRVAARNLPSLRVTLTPGASPPELGPWLRRLRRLWLRAPDPDVALALPAPGVPERWELARAPHGAGAPEGGLARVAAALAAAGRHLEQVMVASPEDLPGALALGPEEVELALDRASLAWLHGDRGRLDALLDPDRASPRLALRLRVPERLSDCVSEVPSLRDPSLAALAARGLPLRGLPPCLGGPSEDPHRVGFVDLEVIDAQGRLDPDRHVAVYLREDYRVHSLRCAACALRPRCGGLHVNLVRAQGFGVLVPRPARSG